MLNYAFQNNDSLKLVTYTQVFFAYSEIYMYMSISLKRLRKTKTYWI